MKKRPPKQLELPRNGGRREGAGRPKTKGIVLHRRRPEHKARFPLHIVLRIRNEVGTLRTDKRFLKIKKSFRYGCDRFGMRLVEFSVQDTHIHLIVEAKDKEAISRGMQGLTIRIAKALNRLSKRRGPVFSERYFSRPLKTVNEVRNAILYVHKNVIKHRREDPRYVDPFSSMSGEARWWDDEARTVANPTTWLFNRAAPYG